MDNKNINLSAEFWAWGGFFWKKRYCSRYGGASVGRGASVETSNQGLGIARVRGRRGGREAPEAPPLVIAEADAALSAQRLRSDTAVFHRGGYRGKSPKRWLEESGVGFINYNVYNTY